jgi:large subunit ribosomal protein L19
MDLMRQIELENMKTDVPDFGVGDTVKVHYLIREGDKERIQIFAGTVISISGSGIRRTALIRRMVAGEGVERVFPIHSPRVRDVEVTGRGRAHRARLFYLRDRVGKGVRLRQNFAKSRGPRSRPNHNPNPERHAAQSKKQAAQNQKNAAKG